MRARIPKITVIIPHYNGKEILQRCLNALHKTKFPDFQILIVDNGSTDGSLDMLQTEFKDVKIIESPRNLGYAGGCNLGIRSSKSPYIVLLNNDTEVIPNWLGILVSKAEQDISIAAVQPKILSLLDRTRFDYCGAAGGEMDIFGYPYAQGRLFQTMEKDRGQYDKGDSIFWATGAAVLLRRSAIQKTGLLDESYFAHMEEIDMCWRLHLAGYKVMAAPEAVVYHQTGATLDQESLTKMCLNHRNSLLTVLKNYSLTTLLWLFPIRLILECLTFIAFLFSGHPKRAIAVVSGILGVICHWPLILQSRKQIIQIRMVPDSEILHRMYRGSVALAYYLKGVRRVKDL